jgi:hypothetical protein
MQIDHAPIIAMTRPALLPGTICMEAKAKGGRPL